MWSMNDNFSMQTIKIIVNFTDGIGYACRADKDSYRHDRRADSQCHYSYSSFFSISTIISILPLHWW